ncbi:MAG: dihydropteroate synthase [Candidatus Schekmanbacteria bacterium]|nr:dihydropteroate synthase [Candidatus Schekmanbacteria bacterium]
MGILNVTPDSFYDGGRYLDPGAAAERAAQLCEEGAHLLDLGAESTRPGAAPVSAREQCARLAPVLRRLAPSLPIPISIDTSDAEVATLALELGAEVINDVSAWQLDPRMAAVVAREGAGAVLMHMAGTPRTMQLAPRYDDVVLEVTELLARYLLAAEAAGVARECLAVDPGIGFGKRAQDNVALIHGCGALAALGAPVIIGPSRKSFIGRMLNLPAEERLEGTLAAVVAAVFAGAHVLRVHDVRAASRAARTAWQMAVGMPGE